MFLVWTPIYQSMEFGGADTDANIYLFILGYCQGILETIDNDCRNQT